MKAPPVDRNLYLDALRLLLRYPWPLVVMVLPVFVPRFGDAETSLRLVIAQSYLEHAISLIGLVWFLACACRETGRGEAVSTLKKGAYLALAYYIYGALFSYGVYGLTELARQVPFEQLVPEWTPIWTKISLYHFYFTGMLYVVCPLFFLGASTSLPLPRASLAGVTYLWWLYPLTLSFLGYNLLTYAMYANLPGLVVEIWSWPSRILVRLFSPYVLAVVVLHQQKWRN